MSNDNPSFETGERSSANAGNEIKIAWHSERTAENDRSIEVQTVGRCGWKCFRPSFLQHFRTAKWVLFWLCWAGALQGMVVNGFVNIVISTIEKRFGMNSFQTGLIIGGYDIASFFCVIPITYLGGRRNASKPRWLGHGAIIFGIGSLVFASPYFLTKTYKNSNALDAICQKAKNVTVIKIDYKEELEGDNAIAMWLFLLGQLLHGAGATPLYTLGVTYIDENVSKKMSSVYIGIFYSTAILGPSIGYVLGGQILELYSDFLTVDPSSLGLTSSSQDWIGAWWFGFLVSAFFSLLIAMVLLAFPAFLSDEIYHEERESEAHAHTETTRVFTKLKEMPRAFRAVIVNPTFFFLNIAAASEGLLLAGIGAFLPKVIENQFSVNAASSSLIMGMVSIPGGGGGMYLGGYVVKKFKLRCVGIIKFCICATILATAFSLTFLITCPNVPLAGITASYENTSSDELHFNLQYNCNSNCNCNEDEFDPICGTNYIAYFSPCYAGCTDVHTIGDSKFFSNCECIGKHVNSVTYDAVNSFCGSTCDRLWLFVGLIFGAFLFSFLSSMPALTATLRCVRDDQRSFAIGIQWLVVRFLGTVPAPIIFGALIDKSCILWQKSCEKYGACRLYNNESMSKYVLGIVLIGKGCSLLFFICAWWFYIPPKKNDEST